MIAAVSVHFNFAGFSRPAANVRRFIRQCQREGIPLWGVEAYLKGVKPTTQGEIGWVQLEVPRHCVMFQKEALINAAVEMVPIQYDKIAWVDHDVLFSNPQWLVETDEKLNNHAIVQPFEDAVWTEEDGSVGLIRPSCAITASTTEITGHQGFAFAARRELFTEHGGLYPWGVVGNGDSMFAAAALGVELNRWQHPGLGGSTTAAMMYEAWYRPVAVWSNRNVGHVPGRVWHEWHGDRKDRKYFDRYEIIKEYDPMRDTFLRDDGALQWSEDADPKMMMDVSNYLLGRAEDGREPS